MIKALRITRDEARLLGIDAGLVPMVGFCRHPTDSEMVDILESEDKSPFVYSKFTYGYIVPYISTGVKKSDYTR